MKTQKKERIELFPLLVKYTDWIMDKRWWPIVMIALLVVAGILCSIFPAIWPIVVSIWVIAMSILWGIPAVMTAMPDVNGAYPNYTRKITWKNVFAVLSVITFLFVFFHAAKGELVRATVFAFLMLGSILFLWIEDVMEKRKNQ